MGSESSLQRTVFPYNSGYTDGRVSHTNEGSTEKVQIPLPGLHQARLLSQQVPLKASKIDEAGTHMVNNKMSSLF